MNEKTFCASGSSTAWLLTVGPTGGVDPESFVHSRYIVIWACNSISTNLHHWPFVLEAQKRGAKVVVIDSYRSRTAKQADWHIMPKPGTDGALAMGIIAALIESGHVDQEWVDKHSVGFPELAERAGEFTPDYVERITGVPGADIATLRARIRHHPAFGHPHGRRARAPCRRRPDHPRGVRDPGADRLMAPCRRRAVADAALGVPGRLGARVAARFHPPGHARGQQSPARPRAGRRHEARSADHGALHLQHQSGEPGARDQQDRAGLSREDLFFVTAEHFVTDTAAYADIVLPATMAGEHDDMMFSWGHFYLTINEKAIEPCGEAKSNAEIFRLLAAGMGFDDPQFKMSDMELAEHYLQWDAPQMAGIDMEYFRKHGYFHLAVGTPDDRLPHAERQVPDAVRQGRVPGEGRQELRRAAVPHDVRGDAVGRGRRSAAGLCAAAREPRQQSALAERYPLNVISPKSHGFLNSCYANEPHKIKGQGEQFVMISPKDAAARSIREGDPVRVYNDRGDFEGLARVTDDVRDGVIVATLGYWRSLNRSDGSVNSISSAEFCGLGRAPTFSDNLVQVVRVN